MARGRAPDSLAPWRSLVSRTGRHRTDRPTRPTWPTRPYT